VKRKRKRFQTEVQQLSTTNTTQIVVVQSRIESAAIEKVENFTSDVLKVSEKNYLQKVRVIQKLQE
jgi:hypothetical protein